MNNRVKEVRKALSLTQTQFGERIGVKGSTITNYESGIRSLSEAAITSICREYNVSERWLRTGEGEMFVTRSREELIAETVGRILTGDNEIKRRWISVLCRMPDEYWDMLDDLVTRYAAEAENDR